MSINGVFVQGYSLMSPNCSNKVNIVMPSDVTIY